MSQSSLGAKAKHQLIDRFLGRKGVGQPAGGRALNRVSVPEAFTRFDRHPDYEKMRVSKAAADRLGLRNPFFMQHEGLAGATTQIGGREYSNFASYNYLGLNGHPEVNAAAAAAVERYGTTVSASRLVAGERPIQRELEAALADVYDAEACVVFVSGHATNVSTLSTLFGPKDLIVHDSLSHNSILEGARLSGATRRSFPHNDLAALEALLLEVRGQFERALIVVEGHYSMDGDIPDLPALVDIKQRHGCFLMVDEAHSLGVLGATGKGLHEHYGVSGKAVDIWMGTLSKTLSGCGGYIAGSRALVELLKYMAPGFVYSVGIAPPLAAASLQALRIMQREPERVARLQQNGRDFMTLAAETGLPTGNSHGYAIIPVITGSSLKATRLSNQLFEQGIHVQPVIHPAVEERAARLRFFLSSLHGPDTMKQSCKAMRALLS